MPDAQRGALLVIDVQQALCSGRHATFQADRVIERINEAARKARAAGAPVVVIQHESADAPFVHGSAGWQVAEGLEASPTDLFVRKTATDSFHRSGLHELLQSHGVMQLAICGMQSDFCVDTTTRRALALGYPVQLLADAHTTMDNGVLTAAQITAHHTATLTNITSFGPRAVAVPAAKVRFDGTPWIRQAGPDEAAAVAAVLAAAAAGLRRKGQGLWGGSEVSEDAVREEVRAGRYHLAFDADGPIGVFRLDPRDGLFWPEIGDGASLFLHKLAVHPRRQGQQLAQALLAYACDVARQRGHRFLRLDCMGGRPKLRAIYQDFGFEAGGDVTLGGHVFHRFVVDLSRSGRTTAPTNPQP